MFSSDAHISIVIPVQVKMLHISSSPLILFELPLFVQLFSKPTQRNCLLPLPLFLSRTPSIRLTGDNYALLSSYCQAQFATQINWAAFEERGGRGEGENEHERWTQKAGDKTITNQQTKQRNMATQSSKIIFKSITLLPHLQKEQIWWHSH